jgi:hypothetical protein
MQSNRYMARESVCVCIYMCVCEYYCLYIYILECVCLCQTDRRNQIIIKKVERKSKKEGEKERDEMKETKKESNYAASCNKNYL